jgi:hypothetical protein
MDVVTSSLNLLVKGDIYMELPEDLQEYYANSRMDLAVVSHTVSGTGSTSRLIKQCSICKHKTMVYGLKEAPHLWHSYIDAFLSTIRFK